MAVWSTMASQFTKDGKYFAHLSIDGKLKIWETATSTFLQEFTPDFHLTTPCRCLHFIEREDNTDQNHSPRKKKRKNSIRKTAPLVALGTNSGLLLVYSISKGELNFTIDSKSNLAVNCISWYSGSILYTAIDKSIVSWNLDTKTINSKWKSGNEVVTAILVMSTERLLTGSKTIKLWDINTKEILKTFVGHSHNICILEIVSPQEYNDIYVISGSKGDRLLSVWNVNAETREKKLVASLMMEDIPINVSVLTTNGTSNLVVVIRTGIVHYYKFTLNGKCNKPMKPKTTIQVACNTHQNNTLVTPLSIVGSALQNDMTLLIGYGNEAIFFFESVVINDYEKVQCLIRKVPETRVKSNESKVTKTRAPVVDNNVHYLTSHTSTSFAKRKADGKIEVPMEKRLENLTLHKLDSSSKVPKVDNVAQLLIQGLHSEDKIILRSVLNQQNNKIIQNTVKRLPIPVIIPLINEVTELIQGKTISSKIGAIWLKQLVQTHTGILISNPELPNLLGSVMGTIENRLSLLTPLNRLRGRLDLLVSQMSVVKSGNEQEDDALLIYDDKESSDSDSENMEILPQSESDNEWVEESDEEGENNEQDGDSDDDVEML